MRSRVIREPRPIGGGVCEVPLSQGKVALIDEFDAEKLSLCNWFASAAPSSATLYAKGRLTHPKVPVHMHRAILCFPVLDVDHINGNGLDNRRANLRLCTAYQNMCNIRQRPRKTSKFRGVYRHGGRWQASIRFHRKLISLGGFDLEIQAAAAYDAASVVLHGEFGVRSGFKPGPILMAQVLSRVAKYSASLPSDDAFTGELVPEPVKYAHPPGRYMKYLDGQVWVLPNALTPNERALMHQTAAKAGGRVRTKTQDGRAVIQFFPHSSLKTA